MLLADSIKPMLGTCQKEVNHHWSSCDSWCPKRAPDVWGNLVKCLGLIVGIILRLPHPLPLLPIFHTPSQFCLLCVRFFSHSPPVLFPLCKVFFALPPSFVPFTYYVFGNDCYTGYVQVFLTISIYFLQLLVKRI